MEWFADFETGERDGIAQVYLGYIKNLDGTAEALFLTIEEMLDFLARSKTRETHKVYFHNLSWDGEFIIWYLIAKGFKPMYSKVEKAGQFKERTDYLGKRAEIYVNYKGIKIRFLCSYRIWPYSVKQIGESLGFPKLEIEHNIGRFYRTIEEVPAEVIEYCKRDVEIIRRKYIDYSKNYAVKKTASACAWYDFQEWYKRTYDEFSFRKDYAISAESYDFLLPAYFGGLTILKPEYADKLVESEVSYYDINSSYPSVIADNLMPYGLPMEQKPKGDYVTLVEAIILNPKKRDSRMCSHLHNWVKLGQARDNYLDEYSGTMRVMYTLQEWEELKLTYDFKVLSYKEIYFKANRKLAGFILEKYHLKEEATNKVERSDHKGILNKYYGKWGQSYRHARKDLVKATPEDKYCFHYGDYVYKITIEESIDIKYLPVAIFVTSLARVKLLKVVRQNLDSWIYGDTDSIIVLGDSCSGVEVHGTKLGAWKKEAKGIKFKAIKTKCYIMEMLNDDGTHAMKKVIAGIVDDKKDNINFDNFYSGSIVKSGNRRKKKITGGYILMDVDIKL